MHTNASYCIIKHKQVLLVVCNKCSPNLIDIFGLLVDLMALVMN